MLTILWDNDGVLVDTEGLYFRATQEVLRTVGVPVTADQFKEISLRRGESTFVLAVERGITDDEIARLRAERDRRYAELLGSQSWAIDGAEEVLRSLHGQVRMGVVTSARKLTITEAMIEREIPTNDPLWVVVRHDWLEDVNPGCRQATTGWLRPKKRRRLATVSGASKKDGSWGLDPNHQHALDTASLRWVSGCSHFGPCSEVWPLSVDELYPNY